MKIFYARKIKGRKCRAEDLAAAALEYEGIKGLKYDHMPGGEPVLLNTDGSRSKVSVSASDTKNFVLVAFAKECLGIDAEENTRKVNPASLKALHPLERQYLAPLQDSEREFRCEFLRVWTAKESYMKYCGAGLRMGTSGFSVIDQNMDMADKVQKDGYKEGYLSCCEGPCGIIVSLCCETNAEEPEFVNIKCDFAPEISALEKAAELLDNSAYTRKGLADKLEKKGYSLESAEKTAEELEDRGYLDDLSFAENFARKQLNKGRGRLKVLSELKNKGVSGETAEEVLDKLLAEEFGSEYERALDQISGMISSGPDGENRQYDEKTVAKAANRLVYLGYDPRTIAKVVDRLRNS